MIITILIVFFTLIGLLVLHELGHFLLAKKFGVEVEEFGVGYPPRIFGKKIGKTIYSLNLLPFGAFVRIRGEEGKIGVEDARSFSGKPIWQRALILIGGVATFWLIGFLIFTFIAGVWGLPTSVSGDFQPETLKQGIQIVEGPQVQIIGVNSGSPAELAGLRVGDVIAKAQDQQGEEKGIDKIENLQEFTQAHLDQQVVLTIKRGEDISEISVIP